MSRALLATAFLALAALAASAEGSTKDSAKTGAVGSAGNASLRFEGIFRASGGEEEAAAAIEDPAAGPAGREALLKAGNYYWMSSSSGELGPAERRASAAKAVEGLERLWKKDRKDDEVCLYLGYAYVTLAGATPLSELETLIGLINKAQNLFGMVVARLPANVDARLARTLINMNLSPQTGRPDALILEDAGVYFAGLAKLDEGTRSNEYYRSGTAEISLAKAIVLRDQGKDAEAKALVAGIDEGVLAPPFKALLAPLKKAYGR
jgi:hypothetical protein